MARRRISEGVLPERKNAASAQKAWLRELESAAQSPSPSRLISPANSLQPSRPETPAAKKSPMASKGVQLLSVLPWRGISSSPLPSGELKMRLEDVSEVSNDGGRYMPPSLNHRFQRQQTVGLGQAQAREPPASVPWGWRQFPERKPVFTSLVSPAPSPSGNQSVKAPLLSAGQEEAEPAAHRDDCPPSVASSSGLSSLSASSSPTPDQNPAASSTERPTPAAVSCAEHVAPQCPPSLARDLPSLPLAASDPRAMRALADVAGKLTEASGGKGRGKADQARNQQQSKAALQLLFSDRGRQSTKEQQELEGLLESEPVSRKMEQAMERRRRSIEVAALLNGQDVSEVEESLPEVKHTQTSQEDKYWDSMWQLTKSMMRSKDQIENSADFEDDLRPSASLRKPAVTVMGM